MKAVFLLATVALALASPMVKRESPFAFVLPDGVELLLGGVKTGFTCNGRIYGYYGDVDNNCKIFHVCVPRLDDTGAIVDTDHYSFGCGNLTTFDQENLVCVHDIDALACAQSASIYDSVNSRFGITDRP